MEAKRKAAAKIDEASREVEQAKAALMAFDSKPTKTKKQIKEAKASFPSLGEESKSPMEPPSLDEP